MDIVENEKRYDAQKVKGLDKDLSQEITKIKKKIDKLDSLSFSTRNLKVFFGLFSLLRAFRTKKPKLSKNTQKATMTCWQSTGLSCRKSQRKKEGTE